MMNNKAVDLAKRSIIDSIWKSANLEGLGTTFPKTEAIIRNVPTETKSEEVLFILNMKSAWQFLLENLDYNNCLMFLRQLNKIVGDKLIEGSGSVRTVNVSIGGTSWKPEIPNDNDICQNLNNLNKIEDIELKALKYFCYIARTQIFIDGNKRVAQLMANKILIEGNIGIFQIPVESLEEFKGLLLDFYETNNDSAIISFMSEYCVESVDGGSKTYVKSKKEENLVFDSKIKGTFKMSESQIGILNKILKNLRNLLIIKDNYTGMASLYSDGKYIILEYNNTMYSVSSNGEDINCVKDNNVCNLSDKTKNIYSEYIINTVKLLNKHIPLYIYRVDFYVSDREFVTGKIQKSKVEFGSVDIYLH